MTETLSGRKAGGTEDVEGHKARKDFDIGSTPRFLMTYADFLEERSSKAPDPLYRNVFAVMRRAAHDFYAFDLVDDITEELLRFPRMAKAGRLARELRRSRRDLDHPAKVGEFLRRHAGDLDLEALLSEGLVLQTLRRSDSSCKILVERRIAAALGQVQEQVHVTWASRQKMVSDITYIAPQVRPYRALWDRLITIGLPLAPYAGAAETWASGLDAWPQFKKGSTAWLLAAYADSIESGDGYVSDDFACSMVEALRGAATELDRVSRLVASTAPDRTLSEVARRDSFADRLLRRGREALAGFRAYRYHDVAETVELWHEAATVEADRIGVSAEARALAAARAETLFHVLGLLGRS